VIMSVLPFAFAAIVYQSDHHYFDIFFQDPLGKIILGASAVLLCIGIFFVFRLSKVDI
jgi:Flp pilus assembly protein TadB